MQVVSKYPSGSDSPARSDLEMISKKEILQQTGISYGQFYRWKRMALIPETWFHRRSTFTGQETFLPRGRVLERIQRIQELKDRYPLEEIAQMLSPDAAGRTFRPGDVEAAGWASPRARALLPTRDGRAELSFLDLLCLRLIEALLAHGRLDDEQMRLAAETLLDRFGTLSETAERHLTIVSCGAATLIALHEGRVVFDRGAEVVAAMDLNRLAEEVKVRLRSAAL